MCSHSLKFNHSAKVVKLAQALSSRRAAHCSLVSYFWALQVNNPKVNKYLALFEPKSRFDSCLTSC